jgi:hypothetical protein
VKFEIKNRWSSGVKFTAEIKCSPDESYSVKLGLAVKCAIKARAYLAGADLTGAYLAGADLTGAYLAGADLTRAYLAGADLAGADLAGADLAGAYLAGADLTGAYLARAYLAGADLAGADLTGAYLAGADLTRAYLAGAKGINKEQTTPLTMLLDQPGKIRAYKLVNENGTGPTYSGINYEIGSEIEEANACTDEARDCANGINVATLDWCLRGWQPGYRILIVEFEAKDIACIPLGTDGKFRLFRCKVIEEKKLDYEALGLVKPEQQAA